MATEYHCLIAGLTEYSFSDKSLKIEFDELRSQIREELTPADAKELDLLYLYYDIQNLVNKINGSSLPFNNFGSLSQEQIEAEIEAAKLEEDEQFESMLPSSVRLSLDIYKGRNESVGDNDEPITITKDEIERRLYADYYGLGRASRSPFLKRWCETDRTIRAIITRRRAHELDIDPEPMMIGELEDEREFEYYTELMAVLDTKDFVERETKMDALRWQIAEELAEYNYFDMSAILSYMVKINILCRWSSLDKAAGEKRFRAIVKSFTDNVKIE